MSDEKKTVPAGLEDESLAGVVGGADASLGRSRDRNETVKKLTLALHAAELHLGTEHAACAQIQKCIDTYYEGRLIRDEVQKAIDILMTVEDERKYNIIAGLNEALAAHAE